MGLASPSGEATFDSRGFRLPRLQLLIGLFFAIAHSDPSGLAYVNADSLFQMLDEMKRTGAVYHKMESSFTGSADSIRIAGINKIDSIARALPKGNEKRKSTEAEIRSCTKFSLDSAARVNDRALARARDSLLAPVYQHINAFLARYGKEHGYAFIFGTPPGSVLYADSSRDLTRAIALEMNREYAAKNKAGAVEKSGK